MCAAPFAMIRAFAPLLKASGDGTVINVSSISGFTGSGSSVAYCAAKAAMDTMTMSLARALGPDIRVHVRVARRREYRLRRRPRPGAAGKDRAGDAAQAIVQPEDVARAILACITHLKVTTGARHHLRRRTLPQLRRLRANAMNAQRDA